MMTAYVNYTLGGSTILLLCHSSPLIRSVLKCLMALAGVRTSLTGIAARDGCLWAMVSSDV